MAALLLIFDYVVREAAGTHCGAWNQKVKQKQCTTSTQSLGDVLLDESGFFSAIMTSGAFTMMQAASFEADDIVPEVPISMPSSRLCSRQRPSEHPPSSQVTLVEDKPHHQCFLLRSKAVVDAPTQDGSGTGGEVESKLQAMEASKPFECSTLCSADPSASSFTAVEGFESTASTALTGTSFVCRGHPPQHSW